MTHHEPDNRIPPATPSSSEIEKIKHEIAELRKEADEKKKDGWDKAAIVGQIISGSVIAILGVAFTYYAHNKDLSEKESERKISAAHDAAQLELSRQQGADQLTLSREQNAAQLELSKTHDASEFDLANRKNFMDFLDRLSKADEKEREELLEQLELIVTNDEAIRIAMDEAHPPFALVDKEHYEKEELKFNQAIAIADHLKRPGRDALTELSRSGVLPDSEIARAVLGQKTKVFIRASNIDDFADITLNGEPVVPHLTFGADTGWVDITNKLHVNTRSVELNKLVFLLTNGPYGGFGGRFQISAGLQQYDTGPYAFPGCPCDKPALQIVASLRLTPEHKVQMVKAPEFTQFAP